MYRGAPTTQGDFVKNTDAKLVAALDAIRMFSGAPGYGPAREAVKALSREHAAASDERVKIAEAKNVQFATTIEHYHLLYRQERADHAQTANARDLACARVGELSDELLRLRLGTQVLSEQRDDEENAYLAEADQKDYQVSVLIRALDCAMTTGCDE